MENSSTETFLKDLEERFSSEQKPKAASHLSQQEKLEELVRKSQRVLIKISAVFPLDLFPNQIVVDENHVNVINRRFFKEEYVNSILIKDIYEVIITSGPFFANMEIRIKGMITKPIVVSYLWKKEAEKVRRAIVGLIAASRANLDLSEVPISVLRKKMDELGKVASIHN